MALIRQDAWSPEEDKKLAELILKHIRSGSTQLAGFAEAAPVLSRTPAACGFRWNSAVRHRYDQELAEAKQERKALKHRKGRKRVPDTGTAAAVARASSSAETLDTLIQFLLDLKQGRAGSDDADRECLETLKQEIRKLKEENQQLRKNSEAFIGVMNLLDQARKQGPGVPE
jgi:prespore-specific regulator